MPKHPPFPVPAVAGAPDAPIALPLPTLRDIPAQPPTDGLNAILAGMRPPPEVLDVHTTAPAPALLPRVGRFDDDPRYNHPARVVPEVTVGGVVRHAMSLGAAPAPVTVETLPAPPECAPEDAQGTGADAPAELPPTAPVTPEALAATGPAPRKRPATGTFDPTSGYKRGAWDVDEDVKLALAVLCGTDRESLALDFPTRSPEALSHRLKRWARIAETHREDASAEAMRRRLAKPREDSAPLEESERFWRHAHASFHTASKAVRETRDDGLLLPPQHPDCGSDSAAAAGLGARRAAVAEKLRRAWYGGTASLFGAGADTTPDTPTSEPEASAEIPPPIPSVVEAVRDILRVDAGPDAPPPGNAQGSADARETVRMAVDLDAPIGAPVTPPVRPAADVPPAMPAERVRDVAARVSGLIDRLTALQETVAQKAAEERAASPDRAAVERVHKAAAHAHECRTTLLTRTGEMLGRLTGSLLDDDATTGRRRAGLLDDARTVQAAIDSGLPVDELALLRTLAARLAAVEDVCVDLMVAYLSARHAETDLATAAEGLRLPGIPGVNTLVTVMVPVVAPDSATTPTS